MNEAEKIAREIADKNAVYGDCTDCDEATMCSHAQAVVAAIIAPYLPSQRAVWEEAIEIIREFFDGHDTWKGKPETALAQLRAARDTLPAEKGSEL